MLISQDWPCYFMCGDHALNSRDSRYWGFVPEEYVVGVVSEVVESIDRATGRERKERRGLSLLAGDERWGGLDEKKRKSVAAGEENVVEINCPALQGDEPRSGGGGLTPTRPQYRRHSRTT